MTTQFPEILRHSNDTYAMDDQPLGYYLREADLGLMFGINTALRRGYQGTWSTWGDTLRLESLNGELRSGEKITLKTIFPNHGMQYRVADWYSGVLHCVSGRKVDTSSSLTHERELWLHVEQGEIVKTERRLSRLANASSHRIMIRNRESQLFADYTASEIIEKFGRLKAPREGIELTPNVVAFFNTKALDEKRLEALTAYTYPPDSHSGSEYPILWKIIMEYRLAYEVCVADRKVTVSHDTKDHNSRGDPVFSTRYSEGSATASFCNILLNTPEEIAAEHLKDIFSRI